MSSILESFVPFTVCNVDKSLWTHGVHNDNTVYPIFDAVTVFQIHETLYGGLDGRDGLNLMTALQQPASVGYVRLNSTNPLDHPLINPNYLAEDGDADMLLDGIIATLYISQLF